MNTQIPSQQMLSFADRVKMQGFYLNTIREAERPEDESHSKR